MADNLVFSGGFLGVDFFFCCAVFAVELFMDNCDFFHFGFGGILITLDDHLSDNYRHVLLRMCYYCYWCTVVHINVSPLRNECLKPPTISTLTLFKGI